MVFCMAVVCSAFAMAGCGRKADYVTMLLGTYSSAESNGIYSYVFDQENGVLRDSSWIGHVDLRDATYQAVSEDGTRVYSVSETPGKISSVGEYSFDKLTGAFSDAHLALADGGHPCYVSTNGRIALTANYTGGSMSVFRLDKNGGLAGTVAHQILHGMTGGPDSARQEAPHMHCALFSPDGEYVLATDFSSDRVISYKIENDTLREYSAIALEPDYGPRHIAFRGGHTAYVIGELSGTITVMDYDAGVLTARQVVECDPLHARGSADIRLSPDGRFLYASNRLQGDGVALFSVAEDGTLSRIGYTLTGIHPRNIRLTPNGKFLLVACRDSDCVEVYRIDPRTGLLAETGCTIPLAKVVCITFVP